MEQTPNSEGERDAYASLIELNNILEDRFEHTGSLDDLNRLIQFISQVLEIWPSDDVGRANWLNNLGRALGRRFDLVGSSTDLDRAIELVSEALQATADDAAPPPTLINLSNQLRRRFEVHGSMDDIDRAIELGQRAVRSSPIDDPHRPGRVNNLASWFAIRYDRTRSLDDLDQSISLVRNAIEATTQEDPTRVGWLNNLGNRLASRFEKTDVIDDLNQAIAIATTVVDATPADNPRRYIMLNNLGVKFGKRYDRLGSLDDLDGAVDALDKASLCLDDSHSHKPGILGNLGNRLGNRYDQTSSIHYLNQAIEATAQAVELTPPDYPERADWLTSLGLWLGTRFDLTGSMNDLNEAMNALNAAVQSTPHDHPRRADRLLNLGLWLGKRAERSGRLADLNDAIESAAVAVKISAESQHPDQASYLACLARLLSARFSTGGSMDDLVRAVNTAESAVAATPEGHAGATSRLHNLAILIGKKYEATGAAEDLDRAIGMARRAVDSIPSGHIYRATVLDNLGNRLGQRYKVTGSIDDLNLAIETVREAVEATPQNHPELASWQSDLGTWLGRRFEKDGSLLDLDRAIEAVEVSVKVTPRDHPDQAVWLGNLGAWLAERHRQTGSDSDLSRALSCYVQGWNCTDASNSRRIELAHKAAHILAAQSNWGQASLLLEEAVKLLPAVSPRSLKHMDKQRILSGFAGLASLAAAAALSSGKEASHALQILELGRGVIASSLLEIRRDISDLQERLPRLADEFTALRDELDSPPIRWALASDAGGEMPSWELQSKRRRDADQKFHHLLDMIRLQPGFEKFLLPPPAEELMAAAALGPIVVVNLSRYRCDALLVKPDGITALELPQLTLEEVQTRARHVRSTPHRASSFQMATTLAWLWDVICRPCLESLGFNQPISGEQWTRLWWVPTGPLGQLPLHAAGNYIRGSTETVLDRVMSSYTPTVKALVYGRRQFNSSQPSHGELNRALLLSMPQTPGMGHHGHLPFAAAEINMLEALCPALHLQPVKPKPRKDEVLQSLPACKVFHFAGHGRSHPTEPSQSSLLLEDWQSDPLTVAHLRDIRLQDSAPFLGYLSACWTGAAAGADALADEGIHLVGAFQLAGFRHVVGTLWEVSDEHCVSVARILYDTIRQEGMTDAAVCLGLHRALRSLRGGGGALSTDDGDAGRDGSLLAFGNVRRDLESVYWIPYAHYGV